MKLIYYVRYQLGGPFGGITFQERFTEAAARNTRADDLAGKGIGWVACVSRPVITLPRVNEQPGYDGWRERLDPRGSKAGDRSTA